jgi:hypothetical protein
MAVVLQITDGTTTADFTTSTAFQYTNAWEPVVASPTGDGSIPGYVVDVLPVIVRITGDDNFAATMQSLHTLQRQAAEYWASDNQVTPVWFYRQLTNESGGVRTLVRSIEFDSDARFGSWIDTCPPVTDGRLGNIAISHHPCWERTAAVAVSGSNNVLMLGDAVDYTDVVGDFPARPYYIHFDNTVIAQIHDQVWMGFRSDARAGGDAANFIALWECESGTNITGSSPVDIADGSPTGGGGANNVMQVTTTDPAAWTAHFSMTVDQFDGTPPHPEAFTGTFVVLMRAKVNAGTIQVKLQQRLVDTHINIETNPVSISATSWTMYNMGTVTFPLRNRKVFPIALFAATYDDDNYLVIWAKDDDGSATTLDCDCLVLIPADEYFVYIDNAGLGVSGDIHDLYYAVAPHDEAGALDVNTGTSAFDNVPIVSPEGAGIPVGDGRMIVAAAKAGGTALTYDADLDIELGYFPRWLSLRGAE